MHWKLRGWTLIGMVLVVFPGAMTVMRGAAAMQSGSPGTIATTQITDTVYRGDGTAANGTVIVSWQAFTTANGVPVLSGTTSAPITEGALIVQLIPNSGSTPMGTYYTAVYHLDDGTVSKEFWVVPVSQSPVRVSAIESQVLPVSVAMQAVSKSYVDSAIAASGLTAVAGAGRATPIEGSTADYNFLEGSGTTVNDSTGNGNNGVLGTGALAPTWTATGLAFGGQQQVALPASLNTSRTFYFGVYINPIASVNSAYVTSNYPMLVGSSLAGNGLNLLTYYNGDHSTGAFAPSIYAGNSFLSTSANLLSGFQVIAMTLGTGGGDVDHFYVNGREVSTYMSQGSSAGRQSSGNLFLGSSNIAPFQSSGLMGTFYRAVFVSGEQTAAQVAANSLAILREIQSRPVVTSPQRVPQASAQLFALGDSITFGVGLANPATQSWSANLNLANQPAYTITNGGMSGASILAMAGSEPNRYAPYCVNAAGPSVVIGFAGTNDITFVPNTGPVTTFGTLMGWVQTLKAAGCKVFVGTMLSRTGTAASGGTDDAAKDVYDSLILSQAVKLGADGVIDFAANPNLGADGANTNTTYFQSDNTHPTAAGQLLLASAASNALNYYFGSNASSPTIVTTATHTIASGEGYISASPTANQTLTLPDCTGPSGAVYTVSNLQSAFTVGVVAGSASQLIDGQPAGTVVPVPSNGSVSFRDVANPKTVSGCHWER